MEDVKTTPNASQPEYNLTSVIASTEKGRMALLGAISRIIKAKSDRIGYWEADVRHYDNFPYNRIIYYNIPSGGIDDDDE
jgi:ABC-type enterochelin transport system ATPase subunit